MRTSIFVLLSLIVFGCASQDEVGSHYFSGTNVQQLPEGEFLVSCINGIGGCYSRMTAICPNGFTEIDRISKNPMLLQTSNDAIRFKCKK